MRRTPGGTISRVAQPPTPGAAVVQSFYVYPNPAGQRAIARYRLGAVTGATAKVMVLDMSGKTMFEQPVSTVPLTDNEVPLSVMSVPSGVYLVRLEVRSDKGTTVKFTKLAIVR